MEDRYQGREGYMRQIALIDEALENDRVEPQEVIDFGDRLLLLQHYRARGRGSGAEVAQAIGIFMTWRGGMIVRWNFYWSQDDALEAAGLRE